MEHSKGLEEKLREASCAGDLGAIKILIDKGVNVNDQHSINGWTALHWASRREHPLIVSYLLANGADKNIQTHSGEIASMVTDNKELRQLIEGSTVVKSQNYSGQSSLPMQPHYLNQQAGGYTVDVGPRPNAAVNSTNMTNGYAMYDNELVLKVRQGCISDKDFIEIEIPRTELSYINLLKLCAAELGLDPQRVTRIRKLPNTMIRKDKDVMRLTDFQEIEVIVGQHIPSGPVFGSNSGNTSSVTTTSAFGTKTTILY